MNSSDEFASYGTGNPIAPPPGIRVVILESDDQQRFILRKSVSGHSDFVVVAECRAWVDCEYVLEQMLPELLIARADRVPPEWFESRTSAPAFPLAILVGEHQMPGFSAPSVIERVGPPLQEDALRRSIGRARAEIFSRKAAELSYLLDRYASHAAVAAPAMLPVPAAVSPWHERRVDLCADPSAIVYLQADRNYVRVHTMSGSYEVRETLTHIAVTLDPSSFVRIHRSVIINLSRLKDVVWFNGTPVAAIMEGGTRMRIGPNHRAAFRQLVAPTAA